ncbi:phage tail sheath family protein [Erwinia oleae]|uniref:phage tail sheath family protein n=1 Tax=Erwinia oleae TaxID=796334 RepID=UPI000555D873|nr:phage tail sheath subtilisin-like domain-containing protein [Erwinia oleae]
MTTVTTAPGIYVEEDATPAISVSATATAVPLFIGSFTPVDSGNTDKIIRVSSWLDFTTKFLAQISANITITSTAPTPPAQEDVTTDLSSDDNASTSDVVPRKAKTKAKTKTARALTEGEYSYAINTVSTSLSAWRNLQLYFQNGGGACYICATTDSTDLTTLTGLVAETPAATLLVCADADVDVREKVYGSLSSLVSEGSTAGVFLLADSNDGKTVSGISQSSHVAAYYPSLVVSTTLLTGSEVLVSGYADADTEETDLTLAEVKSRNPVLAAQITSRLNSDSANTLTAPASVAVAGVWCANDNTRGVWKAPANVVLNGISDLSVQVTDDAQGAMNEAGINVIRYFSDRGYVVWGARTLENDDNWRYIPVRRLFDAAERDIKKALRPMVFETNNQPTWQRVYTAVDNYLYSLWQKGALAGNKPADAWFVQIGKDITMTDADINQGKMIVVVGMAAVRPAEFIILQFTQNMSS